MKEISLHRISEDGGEIRAVFRPDRGMNLISLSKNGHEFIDQSTKDLFDERSSGLGPIIGPHFWHRKEGDITFVPDETLFPFIAKIKAAGGKEPFSHGIGRYVPWNFHASDTTIDGFLSGTDTYNRITLAALEGFDFKMHFRGHLTPTGLEITFDVESEKKPSVAGLHYYYRLIDGKGEVQMRCKNQYNDTRSWHPLPPDWHEGDDLLFSLNHESDYTFSPLPSHEFTGEALFATGTHRVRIAYQCPENSEHSIQIYHPKNSSFVCIEPITANNPRDIKQKKNHIKIRIDLL